MQRRTLIGLFAALAIGAFFAVRARDTPERRIGVRIGQLEQVLSSTRAGSAADHRKRIERAFEEAIAGDVVVRIPDFPELARGRQSLVVVAGRAISDPRGLDVRTRAIDVKLDADGRAATATFDAEIGRPGDELHKDARRVTLRFAEAGGAWQVTSIDVAPETHEEPEARP